MAARAKSAFAGFAIIVAAFACVLSMHGCGVPDSSPKAPAPVGGDAATPVSLQVASENVVGVSGQTRYRDGVYSASAQGKAGDVSVTVTIENGEIAKIVLGDNSEEPAMAQKAQDVVVPQIIEAQSVEGVEAASGATVTSDAIVAAVSQALERAAA